MVMINEFVLINSNIFAQIVHNKSWMQTAEGFFGKFSV